MAEAVGRCIMIWSYVEWQMAVLLAALMKANSEASIAIFLSLRNARAQRDVLTAAADATITDPNTRDIFDAIVFMYGGLQSRRADIAHGVFGDIPGTPDDIAPWIETKHLSRIWIETFHKVPPSPHDEEKLAHKKVSSVYKLRDLEELEAEIVEFWELAFAFTNSIGHLGITDELLRQKCDEPRIATVLIQIRSRKEIL